jgi:hypothetical protein
MKEGKCRKDNEDRRIPKEMGLLNVKIYIKRTRV